MTDKEVYTAVQIELSKENIPVMLLDVFNYFYNKAQIKYVNKQYKLLDTSQEVHDSLSNLFTTVQYTLNNGVYMENPYNTNTSNNTLYSIGSPGEYSNNNEVKESDYNWQSGKGLIIEVLNNSTQINNKGNGYQRGEVIQQSSTSGTGLDAEITILSVDKEGGVLTYSITYTNYNVNDLIYFDAQSKKGAINIINTNRGYLVPLPNNYFHITNCSIDIQSSDCEQNTLTKSVLRLPNGTYNYIINDPFKKPSIDRPYYSLRNSANKVVPDLELLFPGTLISITLDYIRKPVNIKLTDTVLQDINNIGTEINFPDYVLQDIINLIVTIYLEHTFNPRLQSQLAHNDS